MTTIWNSSRTWTLPVTAAYSPSITATMSPPALSASGASIIVVDIFYRIVNSFIMDAAREKSKKEILRRRRNFLRRQAKEKNKSLIEKLKCLIQIRKDKDGTKRISIGNRKVQKIPKRGK